ncbi:MAG: DNA polymerase Y family protein [Gemmataceae bacterium]|nr:DNA polymerase Y family protein [Gemmataceae bacterium]
MKRFGCLFLPHWPIQRRLVEQPDLRREPLVVHERDARRGERVVAGCPLALRAGIRPGMPLTEATALLARRPPSLHTHDPAGDLAALARLAEYCQQFSPFVGWQTLGPRSIAVPTPVPEHLFFDLTGVAGLFGGEPALARAIVTACDSLGYAPRLAVADTPGAAWALASDGREVSTIVEPGATECRLRPLPLVRLRLPADQIEVLGHLGVSTVEQLLELSRMGVAERFGPLIGLRLDQAMGEAEEHLVAHQSATRFESSVELDYPAASHELIDHFLTRMLEQLAPALRARCLGATLLRGRLSCDGGDAVTFEVHVFRATHETAPLAELLRLKLERITLLGPVRRLYLAVDRTAPVGWRERDLFDEDSRQEPEWERLIGRLTSRLGSPALYGPVPVADPIPERAYRRAPAERAGRARGVSTIAIGHRPWRLFSPPIPIVVTCHRTQPVAFEWEDQRHAVVRARGPERIESGWWRGESTRRDYYRVETGAGRRHWIYRDLNTGHWHLHGHFE